MTKSSARRIFAATFIVDDYIVENSLNPDVDIPILNLMSTLRDLIKGELTNEEREDVKKCYQDYFGKDGDLRACSQIL